MDAVKTKKMMTYRWAVWSVMAFAFVIVNFHRYAAGVVKTDLVRDFGITGTTFANLGSMFFYIYVLMQIPSGILVDSWGVRKTVTAGIFLAGVGSILFGTASTIGWAFCGRFLVGLGVSAIFIATLKAISQWFREAEFATMSGMTNFVGVFGGIFAQTPLALMISHLSWRTSFVLIGVLSLLCALLCYTIIRNKPSDMGLTSFTEIEGTETKGSNTCGPETQPSLLNGLWSVLTNWRIYPAFLVFFAFYGAFATFATTWGVSYIVDVYGVPSAKAANYVILPILGIALGCAVVCKISDAVRNRKIPMFCFGIIYLLCWVIIVFTGGGKAPLPLLLPTLFLLGFSASSYMPVFACVKEINPSEISGVSISVINISGNLGAGLMPLIPGLVMDRYGSILPPVELYHKAFMCCFAATIIGLLLIFFIKETHCRNICPKTSAVNSASPENIKG